MEKKKLEFTEIDITNDSDKKMEMFERSGKVSVPQIFIGERHIGGFDDLNELENKGELHRILKG
jgi:glutaredoxin 3